MNALTFIRNVKLVIFMVFCLFSPFIWMITTSCGSNPPTDNFIHLKQGKYILYNNIIWSEGNCDWIWEKGLNFRVEVDENGTILSPLGPSLPCKTSYGPDAGFVVTCASSDINVDITGSILNTEPQLNNLAASVQGDLWGNVAGCRNLNVEGGLYFER